MSAAAQRAGGWPAGARERTQRPRQRPESRPTACLPGERKLFFQKLRGSQRTVCAPQGQVGKWSWRRRGEEAKGWGEGRLLLAGANFGRLPWFLTLWRGVEGARGKWIPSGKLLLEIQDAATHPLTHHCVLTPGNAGLVAPGGTSESGGGVAINREGPLTGPPSFLRWPTLSFSPGC